MLFNQDQRNQSSDWIHLLLGPSLVTARLRLSFQASFSFHLQQYFVQLVHERALKNHHVFLYVVKKA